MSRFLQHDVPEVHDEHGVLGRVDVAEHVPRHGHDIGHLAGFERATSASMPSSFADSRVPDCKRRGRAHSEIRHEPNSMAFIPWGTPASCQGRWHADAQRGLEHRAVGGCSGACLVGDLRRVRAASACLLTINAMRVGTRYTPLDS